MEPSVRESDLNLTGLFLQFSLYSYLFVFQYKPRSQLISIHCKFIIDYNISKNDWPAYFLNKYSLFFFQYKRWFQLIGMRSQLIIILIFQIMIWSFRLRKSIFLKSEGFRGSTKTSRKISEVTAWRAEKRIPLQNATHTNRACLST